MALEIQAASLAFEGQAVLDQITLRVESGEFVALLGPSGSGKSTLLKALAGIQPLDQGAIYLDGQEIKQVNSHFAYMPQNDALLEWLTIYQNVTLYYRIHRQAVPKDQVAHMLKLAGLAGYEDFLPSQLSGGMRQRAAFVRTLLNPASHLLLDEPLGALDAMTRSLMQDWLLQMLSDYPRTTLLVTHDIEEAIYLSDKIYLLSRRPARVLATYDLAGKQGDRAWLSQQGDLKNEIFQRLQTESYLV